MRHVLSLFDLTADEINQILTVARDLKQKLNDGIREPLLPGRTMALLFEKQSLRTRVSFESAMTHLGGGSLFLGADVGWGKRESTADFAQVLGEYVDVVVCRANSHERLLELAASSPVPVINGLTNVCHPCQALADLFTLRELKGDLAGLKLAYVGDANNVARSLAVACGKLGVAFAIASPEGYEFSREFVDRLKAEVPDVDLTESTDPVAVAQGSHAVYTDVWASMGQEAEREVRANAFAAYQVNAELMSHAPDAVFMHCLPARRGEEVTDDVVDGPQSVVIREAGNRMHLQKGLLVWLIDERVVQHGV